MAALTILLVTAALTAAQDPSGPYRLFVGMDLTVKRDNTTLPVRSLKPHEILVHSDEIVRIPLSDAPHFGWVRTPKVGRAMVKVDDLAAHRTTTIQQDLAIKWMTEQARMAVYQQEKAAAEELAYYNSTRSGGPGNNDPFLGPSKAKSLGFEPGFVINDVVVHVYSHGKELATNLSERPVALTRDQAREFLLLSHLADHAVESVAPTSVWELAPAALLATPSRESFDYPAIVTIDRDGTLLAIHASVADAESYLAQIHEAADLRSKRIADVSKTLVQSLHGATARAAADRVIDHTGRVPATVLAALREMIFLPALDLGTPVPGVTRINLADYFY